MKPAHPARRTVCAALGLACAAALPFIAAGRGAAAAPALQPGADLLDSSRWDDMRRAFFGDAPVVFDDRIAVTAPFSAEDPLNVPVAIDATALGAVREVLVFADFSPIVKALGWVEPLAAPAAFGLRLKLQQSSPVRRSAHRRWHLAPRRRLGAHQRRRLHPAFARLGLGRMAAAPQRGRRPPVAGRRPWRPPAAAHRAPDGHRARAGHPGLPHRDARDRRWRRPRAGARGSLRTGVGNPVFSFDLPAGIGTAGLLRIRGRDNNGNLIDAEVRP
ncbi:thiosulfate oxidation carrier protein SoxY [Thauera humireducens]|uniref:thiosulfate oxidation carrier protein SoxY n=1 Tax=Thauera humireducens TaxID=1134435 RepID=UPI00311DDA05